ncbi:Acyl-CoA-binding domain-containing protein 4 (Acyl-CoA binding protein 4) (OsACBP4) [Durusdinium trenchii]|uniref:Acyl-CoA-binding domain-containing protein 4 (Acyl-CoA binding protein 4) (OsACBP4) n=1 Tax=Durusdinium trenchii TaxID=1381693 RepID=A0ABP0Q564_9DINO
MVEEESEIEASSKERLQRKKSSRSLQRRNHLGASTIQSSSSLKGEEGSDSEVESESSEEDPQDLTQQNYCPGQLLQALTSKWKGHTEKMVVQIIRSDVDINEKLTEPWDPGFANFKQTVGAEPLHFAVRLGLLKACTALLECNADIDAQTNTGVSALMVAVMFNRLDVARLLVDAKASVLRQDQNGLSVTDIAILEGNPQMVQMLLEREKQEDEEMEAEVMQGAIDAGADISLLPPVDKSLALDEQEILRQMLKKGS